jgi:D-aminopeptidase
MGLPKDCKLELYSKWPKGRKNLITDVPGVTVGQVTLKDGEINTGVTAVLPHGGNMFKQKVMAGVSVINGFGKSAGLIQVEELGTIETPIILTNTLSVGTAVTTLVKEAISQNPDIGVTTGTVNSLVTECNDGRLNDIRGLHITEDHVLQALRSAGTDFEEGAVGGGTGMVCLGLKGGIGSSSRQVTIDGHDYTVGALVMSNFGSAGNLVIGGKHFDTRLAKLENAKKAESNLNGSASNGANDNKDKGSIIMLIATDIPLNERQLKRVAKRAMISLGRVGSYSGNGSGDIAIAFTTANKMPHYSDVNILPIKMFYDENIDKVFEPAVEAVEEAIISSLYHAETTTGVRGNRYMGLRDFLSAYGK